MVRYSIIVPVYNSELKLGQCVDSILAQSFEDFELILVDDGSTDNSLVLCQQFALADARIKVFSQANQGVGAARNFAISVASGDYLLFLDNDDYWVRPDAIEIIESNLVRHPGLDILIFGVQIDPFRYKREANRIRSTSLRRALSTVSFSYAVWSKAIRRAFVLDTEVLFPNCRWEDFFFNAHLLLAQPSVATIRQVLYAWDKSGETQSTGPMASWRIDLVAAQFAETLASFAKLPPNSLRRHIFDYALWPVFAVACEPNITPATKQLMNQQLALLAQNCTKWRYLVYRGFGSVLGRQIELKGGQLATWLSLRH